MKKSLGLSKIIFLYLLLLIATNSSANTSLPVNNFDNGDCNLNLAIPDQVCQNFSVQVSGETGSLGTDLFVSEIRLIIEHEWDADLDIFLTSPFGQTVELSTDNGSGGDDYGINTANCDQYTSFLSNISAGPCNTATITTGSAPFSGDFLPEGNLSDYNTGNANGIWNLNICDDEEEQEGVLHYFEIIFAPLSCVTPNNLYANQVDSTSALINWIGGNNCNNTLLEFGAAGFTPNTGQGTLIQTDCSPFVLEDLMPSTEYEVYIRELCDNGLYSDFSCPVNFLTDCSPGLATLTETFDNQNICLADCDASCAINGTWFNVSADENDWIVYSSPTPTANTGPSIDADNNPAGAYIYMETSCISAQNRTAGLYSNCIDIVAEENGCHLTFNYMIYGSTANNIKLELTQDGQQWLNIWEVIGNQNAEWLNASIDLSAYDGETIQFRFSATDNGGSLGDVALDNISFHGSATVNPAEHLFFVDNDGDGYGDNNAAMASCFTNLPIGFSAIGGDCNDNTAFINPGMPESPCDGADTNCNPDDDDNLPAPLALGSSVCSGETDTLYAGGSFFGDIYWYDAPQGGNLVHIGYTFIPPAQINSSNNPLILSYFVEEINFLGCTSAQRTEVTLTILPTPETDATFDLNICAGESIDLSLYPFTDAHQTNFNLSYHSSLPPNENNKLANSTITPSQNSIYFIVATTTTGCFDAIPLSVTVNPVPDAQITGSPIMCIGTEQTLSVFDNSSTNAPYSYLWNNGTEEATTTIQAPTSLGQTDDYQVQLTNGFGCTDTANITINNGSGIEPIAINIQNVSECDESDGSITLIPSAGVAPFTYTWQGISNGTAEGNAGAYTIENLAQGSYSVTVRDNSSGANCEAIIPFVLVNGPAAIVDLDAVNDVSCYGAADGNIQLSVFGDNPEFEWSNGLTTEDAEDLTPGIYHVTITDNDCESILTDIEIKEPDTLLLKPTAFANPSCAEVNDGSVEVIAVGGTPDYNITWNTNNTGALLENLSVGIYSASVTDSNGCEAAGVSFNLNAPAPLDIHIIEQNDVRCLGENNGSVKLEVTGGTAPFIYQWADGYTLNERANLAANSYSVSVTDFNGCSDIIEFEINEPSEFTINSVNINTPDCVGSDNGFISVMTVGGNTPYSFHWSNGATSFANTNLVAGTYALTIEDANACQLIDSFTLEAPVAVAANYQTSPASCLGSSDGAIYLTESIGSAPFSYEWNTGDNSSSLTEVEAGTYSFTITDSNNCSYADTINLSAEQPINLAANINPPNCHGETTGSISLNPFGGVPFYQFNWSNASSTQEIDNLASGSYIVTVSDAIGCYIIDTFSIIDPSPLTFNLLSIDSVTCAGGTDGQINVRVEGGAAPYNFTWTNTGVLTENLSNVPAGTYSLLVQDANDCSMTSPSYDIGEAAPLSISDNLGENTTDICESSIAADSLELIIEGGQTPYSLLWNTGQTTNILYDVEPAEYTATISDARGCHVPYFKKISEPRDFLQISEKDTTFAEPCEDFLPQICIEIEGGKAPYAFLWDDAQNGITSDATLCRNIAPGLHSITISDDDGCTQVLDNILVNPTIPLNMYYDANDVNNVDCLGSANGSISVEVTGGSPTYTYIWTNQAGDIISLNNQVDNLAAGQYSLTVTDILGCQVSESWEITEPASLIDYTAEIINNPCPGDALGFIDLTVFGGTPGYTYEWTTGSENQDLNNLSSGFYGVTITDMNDCARIIDTMTFEVTEPTAGITLADFIIEDSPCFSDNSGSIYLDIFGGSPNYLFAWSDISLGNTPNPTDLAPGDYNCTISDANGCSIETPLFTISEPDELTAEFVMIAPATGTVEIAPAGGMPFSGGNYIISWSNGGSGTIETGLPMGDNSVTITDANGCQLVLPFSLTTQTYDTNLVESALVFPNPATDKVYFSLELNEARDLNIEIKDILGRKLFEQEARNARIEHLGFDLKDFATGIYFIQVQSNEQHIGTWRVIKE